MFDVSIIEFFLRAIPEGFLLTFAVYAFSKSYINKNKYLVASLLMGVITFGVRFLPIHYGVHTIINIIMLIILSVSINKMIIIKSIQSVIFIMILQFICEGINIFIIQYIFRADIKYVFSDSLLKTLYGIPSLLIFATIIGMYYYILLTRKELKNV